MKLRGYEALEQHGRGRQPQRHHVQGQGDPRQGFQRSTILAADKEAKNIDCQSGSPQPGADQLSAPAMNRQPWY